LRANFSARFLFFEFDKNEVRFFVNLFWKIVVPFSFYFLEDLCGSRGRGGNRRLKPVGSSANANNKVTAARSRQRTDVIKKSRCMRQCKQQVKAVA
jgi:hypothetical protein